MRSNKLKIILLAVIALTGFTASLIIQYQAQLKFRKNEELLHQQNAKLAILAAEHRRLSNLITAEAGAHSNLSKNDIAVETAKLRAEAETLRKKVSQMGTPLPKSPALPTLSALHATPVAFSRDDRARKVVSDSESEEYKLQLYRMGASDPHASEVDNIDAMKDAQNLAEAVRQYAREHGGEFPLTFELAMDYFFKEYRNPRSEEYEMVYHGSLNDLTNIPHQAIALLRERQPWPTPDGKQARIYAMANGFVKVVESGDKFQSWEAEHVISLRPDESESDMH